MCRNNYGSDYSCLLNFTGVFELHSLASYRSDWDSVLLSNVTDDQGPAFIKIRNISLLNLEGNESWFLNIPDVLSCNRQKPPHGPHLLQMWLVLHSLNETFVNAAWALPFSLKLLSSSQPLGPCPFCPNHSIKVNTDLSWINEILLPVSLLLRLRGSCHLPDETEFLRTYKCGDWGDVSHVGICSPCVKKQRKVIYKETRRLSRWAEKNRDSQGRSGGTSVSDLSALNPPSVLPFDKIPLVPYKHPLPSPCLLLKLARIGQSWGKLLIYEQWICQCFTSLTSDSVTLCFNWWQNVHGHTTDMFYIPGGGYQWVTEHPGSQPHLLRLPFHPNSILSDLEQVIQGAGALAWEVLSTAQNISTWDTY